MDRAPTPEDFYGHDIEVEDESEEHERRIDAMRHIRDDFAHLFTTPQGERVITYLYEFCRQGTTTFSTDPCEMAMREGMRRVYLQIAGFAQMTDETVFELAERQLRERMRA